MKSNGKNICAALKQVRKRVADTNGIVYAPKECHFEGDCNGTCPACEAEVRYLEHQLSLLRKAGKAATVMGVAVGMTMVAGCKTSNANAPSASPQGTGQTNRVETGSKYDPHATDIAHRYFVDKEHRAFGGRNYTDGRNCRRRLCELVES